MTDVLLSHTPDGGEVEIINGLVTMTESGLETAAYLSLFGGNDDDGGGKDTEHREWWGNKSETDLSRRYRSETQYLLHSLPLVPANLRRLEEAAQRDLAWMMTESVATAVAATATIPALNTVKLLVSILVDGRKIDFEFLEKRSSQ